MIVTNNKIQKLLKQNKTDEIVELLSDKKADMRLNAFMALSDFDDTAFYDEGQD